MPPPFRAPVLRLAHADILKAFSLNYLVGGTRFAHARQLQDDEALATTRKKPDRQSHHPLACMIGGTRLCLHMSWHEQGNGKRHSNLFKIKLTANVKKAIAKDSWDHWQGKSNEGVKQLAQIKLKLTGWSRRPHMIAERSLKPLNASPKGSFWRQFKEDFSGYVTNLTPEEADESQIVGLYRQRADAEWGGVTWIGAHAT